MLVTLNKDRLDLCIDIVRITDANYILTIYPLFKHLYMFYLYLVLNLYWVCWNPMIVPYWPYICNVFSYMTLLKIIGFIWKIFEMKLYYWKILASYGEIFLTNIHRLTKFHNGSLLTFSKYNKYFKSKTEWLAWTAPFKFVGI